MNALELAGVGMRFSGNEVLAGISFALRPGERVALIGPNGAGKSTLFNLISGELPPSAGSVHLYGADLSRQPAHRRVHAGLARSFQLTSLLHGMSIQDNLLAALHGREPSRFQMLRGCRAYGELLARAQTLLTDLGLWGRRDAAVASLSYGEQKRLEVAMTLALRPRVLLLDEPAAGLAAAEVPGFIAVIRRVLGDATLLFTEHDMGVVFDLAERVIVLARGRLIADGPPAAVRDDPLVRELYLGAAADRHA